MYCDCRERKLTLLLVILVYELCQFLASAHDLAVFYHHIGQMARILKREWVPVRRGFGGMLIRDERW